VQFLLALLVVTAHACCNGFMIVDEDLGWHQLLWLALDLWAIFGLRSMRHHAIRCLEAVHVTKVIVGRTEDVVVTGSVRRMAHMLWRLFKLIHVS